VFGSCFARFFASWRIFGEVSMPRRSLAELAMYGKRIPVPQPMSKMRAPSLRFVFLRAVSILAFCSSAYWAL